MYTKEEDMARFEMIPYVFELARVQTGWDEKKNGKFVMRYEEYTKYLDVFESLDDSKLKELVDRVRSRKSCV